MPGDDHLADFFEDLEQQAAGLHLTDRDAELADRGAAEYAAVDLAGRLHASVGGSVQATVAGVGPLQGTLRRVGAGWFLLVSPGGEWAISTAAVEQLHGLSVTSVSEPLRSVTARLTLGSVLRATAGSGAPVVVHHRSGERVVVRVLRVGADFVEVAREEVERGEAAVVLPLAGIAGVRLR